MATTCKLFASASITSLLTGSPCTVLVFILALGFFFKASNILWDTCILSKTIEVLTFVGFYSELISEDISIAILIIL